jgi:hypothetical protein
MPAGLRVIFRVVNSNGFESGVNSRDVTDELRRPFQSLLPLSHCHPRIRGHNTDSLARVSAKRILLL